MTIEKNKLYLVTGATGFLGQTLVEKIIALGGRVRALVETKGS